MLGRWRSHVEYQAFVIDALKHENERCPGTIENFETTILKLYGMNLDSVLENFIGLFSIMGRPSNQQPEILRAFILMADQKEGNIDKWVKTAAATPLFCALVGVEPSNFPGASTLRDFISRLWQEDEPCHDRVPDKKPKDKYGNEKMPPKNPSIIKELADKALQGATFEDVPENLLQSIFNKVALKPSLDAGLIKDSDKNIASGDGTCINSNANPRGKKICECEGECDCARRFADPQANWGWDSYHKCYFWGYTAYILSTHNPDLKLDLPIYFRIEQASAFDGVTFIKAFAHAKSILQGYISIDSLLLDSAHDNYATYELLSEWDTKPFIDLNQRSATAPQLQNLILSSTGAPICADGYEMINWGYDRKRFRIKYRCPLVAGTVNYCPYSDNCNKSHYGKIVYIYTVRDLRLLTPVPRNTDKWNETYNQRTASERVNNRVLTDYQLERPKRYGKKKLAFFGFLNAVNVHLDAQVKFGKMKVSDLFI